MSFEVFTTEQFLKDVKSIVKIYPGFKRDIHKTISLLQTKPEQGKSLGHGLYKQRISISGKASGKSYGARIIHLLILTHQKVFLLTAYDKSVKKDLSASELKILIEKAKSIHHNLDVQVKSNK